MAHNNDKTNLENYDVNNAAFLYSEHMLKMLVCRNLISANDYCVILAISAEHYNIDQIDMSEKLIVGDFA